MTVVDLERLYDYGYWANAKLFRVLATLTPEEFTRPVAGSYGSIRNTLVHVLSAEWGWIERGGGPPRGTKLNPDDYPTLESLTARWSQVEGYLRTFLASLQDADLARPMGAGADDPVSDLIIGNTYEHYDEHAGWIREKLGRV